MAYQLTTRTTIQWIGDGAGPMSVPSAQVLTEIVTTQVPGGDAPTTGNITTATNNAAAQVAAALNANIGQIQGFATGGG